MKNADTLRKFGRKLVGPIPWGTHLCQFYETKQDLIDILVPYFAEGLHSNEFCMWITSPPLEVEEATKALKETVPDLDKYVKKGQIEIIPYDDWYLLGGKFDSKRVLQGWVDEEKAALRHGFKGLRLTGNTFWVERDLWNSFVDYEEAVNSVIGEHRMIAVCTYCLLNCSGTDVIDVVRNHVGTLIKQGKKWSLIENASRRKLANGALELSEQKYSSLFENMVDGFAYHKILLDSQGKPANYVFLEANKAFEKLTGLKLANIKGKKATDVLPDIDKDPADWIGVYGKVALTGKSVNFENYAEPLNRWYRVSAFTTEKGYFAAVFEDITELKKAQKKLEEYSKNLEKLVEERTKQLKDSERLATIGTIAGMVGHDIRNPLQAIISDLYLARQEMAVAPNDESKQAMEESLTEIEKNIDYINKIVADLQDYARPIQPVAQQIDLESLCNDVVFKNGVPERIGVSCRIDKDAKMLLVDPALLKRILSNLVNNAVQAMPEGGKLAVSAFKQEGDTIVTVEDTGVGIPQEIRSKLFTPLFTTKSKGQGFGLAVVKRITEALGGWIAFESETGKGTKFIVRFPSPKKPEQ